jgi:hypothetical protein
MVESMETKRSVRRVQLDLPPSSMETLEELKEQMEVPSYAEVIRTALFALKEFRSRTTNGARWFIKAPDGVETEIAFIFGTGYKQEPTNAKNKKS